MNRILIWICIAGLPVGYLAAQDSRVDSLLHMAVQVDDNELANTFYELSLSLQENYPDSALYFANRAELMLQRDDPEALLPHLYKTKGQIYENKLQTERSLLYYRKAYDEFIKLENYSELGVCAHKMGDLYHEMANYSEAYFFYLQRFTIAKPVTDFPAPLSPTIPRRSPLSNEKLTPLMAVNSPNLKANLTSRSITSSR